MVFAHFRAEQALPISSGNVLVFRQPQFVQPGFRNAAGDRVGRVIDVADVVAHGLAHQVAGAEDVEPVVFDQPAHHFAAGML